MPDSYRRSRSPVRAINSAAHPEWVSAVSLPRPWSEATARDVVPVTPLRGAEPDNPLLACPDCGATLQLALVPFATRSARPESVGARISRVTTESAPLPDFEDSVRRYKRDLISRALEENDGVMTRAAKALGLKYTTFVAMVHRLDVSSSESDEAGS